MARGRRLNAKGRSTGAQPFVMLPQWAFDCLAYRSLKPGPRALLWELIRRHNGTNNGRIGFSQRDMSAAINIADRETVAGYARELEGKGFIIAKRRGGFNVKAADRRASEWALTWLPVAESPATKDFMRWQREKIDGTGKPAARGGKVAPEGGVGVRPCANLRDFPSVRSGSPADSGSENPPTYTSIAISTAQRRTGS